jgi:hypothetical protein
MKLAILTTAVFNNLLFHKAKLSTMIYYDLDILKKSPCLSSVATVHGSLPYSHASSKAPERRCLRIFQGVKWLHPSREVVHNKLKLQVLSKVHRFDYIIQGLGKNGYCGIIHGLS